MANKNAPKEAGGTFEAFVAAILRVPKDEITEAEGKRSKRARPKGSPKNKKA